MSVADFRSRRAQLAEDAAIRASGRIAAILLQERELSTMDCSLQDWCLSSYGTSRDEHQSEAANAAASSFSLFTRYGTFVKTQESDEIASLNNAIERAYQFQSAVQSTSLAQWKTMQFPTLAKHALPLSDCDKFSSPGCISFKPPLAMTPAILRTFSKHSAASLENYLDSIGNNVETIQNIRSQLEDLKALHEADLFTDQFEQRKLLGRRAGTNAKRQASRLRYELIVSRGDQEDLQHSNLLELGAAVTNVAERFRVGSQESNTTGLHASARKSLRSKPNKRAAVMHEVDRALKPANPQLALVRTGYKSNSLPRKRKKKTSKPQRAPDTTTSNARKVIYTPSEPSSSNQRDDNVLSLSSEPQKCDNSLNQTKSPRSGVSNTSNKSNKPWPHASLMPGIFGMYCIILKLRNDFIFR